MMFAAKKKRQAEAIAEAEHLAAETGADLGALLASINDRFRQRCDHLDNADHLIANTRASKPEAQVFPNGLQNANSELQLALS